LFKGLSRTQVHYIIMAGSLKNLEQGEVLFRKGDASDSMYAVISGGLDIVDYVRDEGPSPMHGIQKLVNQLDAGAVLGEMGLLRSVPRSATVIANSPTELLKINWKMIQRLQWLFPPTAQKFFLNLMTMLCDRVENLSQCVADESSIDDLTGLCNRRGFNEALSVEVRRAQRYGEELALCLISIGIKNEQALTDYRMMDRIFRIVGQILSEEIRSCDTLGRVDAQTFGIVMTRATSNTARMMCERLKRVIDQKLRAEDITETTLKFSTSSLETDPEAGGADMMANARAQLSQHA
jgi:diguanylate cyclase (GGDEF)-like protein